MIQNPILKVLSILKKHKVKYLLIGGQASIIYGAAEFSRDSDFVILCNDKNIMNLRKALISLKAENIYVPPLEKKYLNKGHACHFRCHADGVEDLRVDILSKMRGCDSFLKLWRRRDKVVFKNGMEIEIIGLADLARSKKTQRDKDWLMLKRLVENDILLNKNYPADNKMKWWLLECRESNMLIDLTAKYPDLAKRMASKRPLLSFAIKKDAVRLVDELRKEELAEREKDVEYWKPLREELEKLRHKKIS